MVMMLLLVSNRLPVSVARRRGGLRIQVNPGGVASSLGAFYKEYHARWLGWPGDVLPSESRRIAARLEKDFDCHPVFLPRPLARAYYAGFSNGTLWPLFHSFSAYARYSAPEWEAYREVNERFANEVAREIRPNEVVWIHDYQLMLLPQLLRDRVPDARIGFFLHVPFPPYEVLRQLPWHRELLQGVLGADLIGFHTYDYVRAFLGSVLAALGLDNQIGTIVVGHRVVQVDVFPLGIDFATFAAAPVSPSVERAMARLRRGIGPSKLLFSISRLDYTKGIPQQLEAFGRFLESHPEWRGRVTYFLAVVPSRERVSAYARLKREIDEHVGRINSRYGTIALTPIRYLYRQLEFEELLALYRASDVALIAPLRDGMNLIAKEYVAARQDGRGVLILSEMAGSSKELLEALIVNPNDTDEIVRSIHRALTMPPEEEALRIRAMRDRLERYDAKTWSKRFLERLDEVVRISEDLVAKSLTDAHRKEIRQAYRKAERRLLLLDYDGTLVSFRTDRDAASPNAQLSEILKSLGSDARNHVVVVSGRRRHDLAKWLGELPFTLIAEHGGWVRDRADAKWKATLRPDASWKDRVRPIIERFVDRIPGSSIEEKDFSLSWHHRAADFESGTAAAKELVNVLTAFTANLDLRVLPGDKVVEIRRAGADKGTYFVNHLSRDPGDFILAVGDDWTDEGMFSVLPPNAFSIRVGFAASAARFRVERSADVVDLLEGLAK